MSTDSRRGFWYLSRYYHLHFSISNNCQKSLSNQKSATKCINFCLALDQATLKIALLCTLLNMTWNWIWIPSKNSFPFAGELVRVLLMSEKFRVVRVLAYSLSQIVGITRKQFDSNTVNRIANFHKSIGQSKNYADFTVSLMLWELPFYFGHFIIYWFVATDLRADRPSWLVWRDNLHWFSKIRLYVRCLW